MDFALLAQKDEEYLDELAAKEKLEGPKEINDCDLESTVPLGQKDLMGKSLK